MFIFLILVNDAIDINDEVTITQSPQYNEQPDKMSTLEEELLKVFMQFPDSAHISQFLMSDIKKILILRNLIVDDSEDNTNDENYLHTRQKNSKNKLKLMQHKLLEIITNVFGKMNGSIEAAQSMMVDIEDILDSAFKYLKAECDLATMKFEIENQELVIKKLSTASKKIKETLAKMNTEHKVQTTLINKDFLVMPEKRTFNEKFVQIGESFQTVKSEVTILPIEFQIRKTLERPKVLERILDYQQEVSNSNPGEYINFLNGETWKKIKKKFGNKDVIPIFLYNDDFSPDDTVSVHGSSNKISAFYYK